MNRKLTRKRCAAVLCAAATTAVAVSSGAPSAFAADDRNDHLGDALTKFNIASISATLKIDPNSTRTSLVDLHELTGVVDAAGKVIGSLTIKPIQLPVAFHAAETGKFSCVENGTSNDFVAYQPSEIFRTDEHSVQQDKFFLYRKDQARKIGSHRGTGLSSQYEMCATGGAQPRGARAVQIGLGVAFPDAEQSFKIGQDWKTGSTPANYTSTLGFQLGPVAKVPVQISGSISQTPNDKLMGSITGPFQTPGDAYARNAVNAWWQDSCLDTWHGCHMKWNGTKDFQGTVAQGLWEFTPDQLRQLDHFEVRSYIKY